MMTGRRRRGTGISSLKGGGEAPDQWKETDQISQALANPIIVAPGTS